MRRNKKLFKSVVTEPMVLQMQHAAIEKVRHDKDWNNYDVDDFPRPTSFLFLDEDDFILFLDKMIDEQHLKVDCEMQITTSASGQLHPRGYSELPMLNEVSE